MAQLPLQLLNDFQEFGDVKCTYLTVRLICVHVCSYVNVCVCTCVYVFSITYVPAEYLEEYKASLEQEKDDVFSEAAPVPVQLPVQAEVLVPVPAPPTKYVLTVFNSHL